MTEPKPSLFATLSASVDDATAALRQMPALSIATLAAFVALRAIDAAVVAHFGSESLMAGFWFIPYTAGTAAAATPMTVLISRHVVLWEALRWASLGGRSDLLTETFAAIWKLVGVAGAPLIIVVLLAPSEFSDSEFSLNALMVALFLISIVWFFVALVRFFSYVTSIAVEGKGAGLRSSWAFSHGRAWRVGALFVPLAIALLAVEIFWLPDDGQTPRPFAAYAVLMGALDTLNVALFSALAAHVYLWRKPQVATPA